MWSTGMNTLGRWDCKSCCMYVIPGKDSSQATTAQCLCDDLSFYL